MTERAVLKSQLSATTVKVEHWWLGLKALVVIRVVSPIMKPVSYS